MAQAMGIGRIGFNNIVFKRKFRWTLEIRDICGGASVPKDFVKLASRPNISIEETEINYLHGKTWLPGKGTWETITVTYFDVAATDNLPLYSWLATIYDYTDPVNLRMGTSRRDYAGTAVVTMLDGCGEELERWTLRDLWPTAINWGDLDYSNSEECTIELTLRYGIAEYEAICPNFTPTSCCTPCGDNVAADILPGGGAGFLPNTGSNFR